MSALQLKIATPQRPLQLKICKYYNQECDSTSTTKIVSTTNKVQLSAYTTTKMYIGIKLLVNMCASILVKGATTGTNHMHVGVTPVHPDNSNEGK